jgi:hypothetical protein
MPVFAHKQYYVHVHVFTPRVYEPSTFIPSVQVSAEKEGNTLAGIVTTETFASESDANEHGFEMGKNWIDKRTEETASQRRRA